MLLVTRNTISEFTRQYYSDVFHLSDKGGNLQKNISAALREIVSSLYLNGR